jgi:large subunit ribosomal protein L2
MPKRLRSQRRGKGKLVFRAPSFHYKYKTQFRLYDNIEREERIGGKVIELLHDAARTAPTMIIEYDDGRIATVPAPYGMRVGDIVAAGAKALVAIGNVLPLKSIPAGTQIFNVELAPGDGGKFVRTSGSSAEVVTKEGKTVLVKLPSKEFKRLDENCRAIIGTVAGFGRKEMPIVKAGKHYFMTRARGKYWPNVCGVAMNAVNHPHGGKRRSTQKSKKLTVSRNAPPGAKVGSIAARRTGIKKGTGE